MDELEGRHRVRRYLAVHRVDGGGAIAAVGHMASATGDKCVGEDDGDEEEEEEEEEELTLYECSQHARRWRRRPSRQW